MRNVQVLSIGCLTLTLALAGCGAAPKPEPTPTPSPSKTITLPSVPIVDGGKRDGATGAALHDTKGEIIRYIVASGDSAYSIMERFGLDLLLQLVNEEGKEVRSDTVIFAGETLALVPNSELEGSLRVVDGGPIPGAMGTTTTTPAGRPLTYTVAAGDSADLIRKRFDIWWDQLADSDGFRLTKSAHVVAGQVLTFTGSQVALKEEKP